MKRIVLTGGGTAGHVSPNLALIPLLKEKGYDIHYLGTKNGIEHTLTKNQPLQYHAIASGKLRRYFSLQNFIDPFKVVFGFFQSVVWLGRIKPHVVFSKGGFVAVPVTLAASLLRIPVVCHESDMSPGLANRISAGFAQKICTTFPSCAKRFGAKGIATGTPLRRSLFEGQREKGLSLFGFSGKKPVLLIMGGSQGARAVNQCVRQALPRLLEAFDVIHLCGKGNEDAALANTPGYAQAPFLTEELPHALAAADVVLSRAGSNAIVEFAALKKPMLLIPLPLSASRGDQIENARFFAAQGIARVLDQENMTEDSLLDALHALLDSQSTMRAAFEAAPPYDGAEAVLNQIIALQK